MERKEIAIIIIFVLFITYLFYSTKSCRETFTSKYALNPKMYQGRRREGIDLMDDSLFKDIVVYSNDEDPYEPGGRLGIDKCLDECPGKCVEFGVTGIGYCFPG